MTSEGQAPEDPVPGNIKRLRERRGLSQSDLAGEMTDRGRSWKQNTVYRVESGKQEITLREAGHLAAILGVQVADLTRPGPEAAEIARAENAGMSLRRNWANAATAVDGLLTAREEAAKAVRQAVSSEHASVREAGHALATDLGRMTVGSVTRDGQQPAAESAG